MKIFQIFFIMCYFTFSLNEFTEYDNNLSNGENTCVFDFDSANKNIKMLEKHIDKQKYIISYNKKKLHNLQKQLSKIKDEVKKAKKIIKLAQTKPL